MGAQKIGGNMELSDLRRGDIVTYASGRTNYVNKPQNYEINYTKKLTNIGLGPDFTIMKIQRYKKVLCFYILVTIFKRKF